jgi:hypothetical protein
VPPLRWPVRATRGVPSAPQVRADRFSLAVASQVPSGEIATAFTPPLWPVRVKWRVPSAAQIRTDPSELLVACQVPSGEIATAVTGPPEGAMPRICASGGWSGGSQDGQAVHALRPDRTAGSWLATSGTSRKRLVSRVVSADAGSIGLSRWAFPAIARRNRTAVGAQERARSASTAAGPERRS